MNDPYEEADREAARIGISDTAWRVVTEIGRFSKKEHVPPTKKEISRALFRIHGHTTDITYSLRKCLKQGFVVKVGTNTSGGATYGLTKDGARLVGFQCPVYNEDGLV